ncbi:MAG: hypothetical protein MSA15_17055 [Clostridium sp.]|nr:hypothetical protein [Clostridium sp.]
MEYSNNILKADLINLILEGQGV